MTVTPEQEAALEAAKTLLIVLHEEEYQRLVKFFVEMFEATGVQ